MDGFNYADVQSESRAANTWLRLKTGDKIKVVFMVDSADPDFGAVFYKRHKWNGKTYPFCTRPKEAAVESCPLCKAGDPVQWRMRITVWNVGLGKRQRLDGIPAMFFEDMKTAFEYADPETTVFVLERKGEKSQTRYPIHSAGAIPDAVLLSMEGQRHFTKRELLPELDGHADTEPDEEPQFSDEDAPF